MSKKDFLKRMGNLYALGIQKGFSEEEMQKWADDKFKNLKKETNKKEP